MARIVRKRKLVEPPKTPLAMLMEKHLENLRLKNYSEYTIKGRRVHIQFFLDWATERGITEPVEVTRTILERYQKHVFDYRKSNGEPLGFGGQHDRIVPLRVWFRWMARQHHILHNPASEIELPRTPQRLPKAVLTASEAERVMLKTNIHDVLGLRDRAILETFYSTGMRRLELATLKLWDLDLERATTTIRLGKGKKDRFIPLGDRCAAWIAKYIAESRVEAGFGARRQDRVPLECRRTVLARSSLRPGARLCGCGANRQARRVPLIPAHHGNADARRRRRHPLHPGDAGPRGSEDDADLHARGDPPAAGDPSRHASGKAGTQAHTRRRRGRRSRRVKTRSASVLCVADAPPRGRMLVNAGWPPAGGRPARADCL